MLEKISKVVPVGNYLLAIVVGLVAGVLVNKISSNGKSMTSDITFGILGALAISVFVALVRGVDPIRDVSILAIIQIVGSLIGIGIGRMMSKSKGSLE